jgi:hypothetical protein
MGNGLGSPAQALSPGHGQTSAPRALGRVARPPSLCPDRLHAAQHEGFRAHGDFLTVLEKVHLVADLIEAGHRDCLADFDLPWKLGMTEIS